MNISIVISKLQEVSKSPSKLAAAGLLSSVCLYMIKKKFSKIKTEDNALYIQENKEDNAKKKQQGQVNLDFLNKLIKLLKIAFPKLFGKETISLIILSSLLVLRTFLSIWISDLKGSWVRSIVRKDLVSFIKHMILMTLYSFPSAAVNSGLEFLNRKLGLYFRKNLTKNFQERYLDKMCFYQITNLDSRISHPDQIFSSDIELWATSVANLYSNITKPLLDIVLFIRKLSQTMGKEGPIAMVLWYIGSAIILKYIAPPFGKMIAIQQNIEGEYRSCNSSLITYSEEIAFYRGHNWEKAKLNKTFKKLISHLNYIQKKKLFMGTFDSLLTKYGAVMTGYTLLGIPIFSGSDRYIRKYQHDSSSITKDYIRNSGLLVNLAKAIGRLIYSYKDIQNLAGYTHLVDELTNVIDDINNEKYIIANVDNNKLALFTGGKYEEEDIIEFDSVPIVTPNGDILIKEMKFTINQGDHTLISGPNGCGKSSLFRILGNLWPLRGGVLRKPHSRDIFYIPQRPYLPSGTLRDQIIYPHTYKEFKQLGRSEEELIEFMKFLDIDILLSRSTNKFDEVKDWEEVLAWGEKQLIAMTRLYYHKPKFAILDECSSSVSIDMEAKMYEKAKEMGITLITVSHRRTVWKYHDYILRFNDYKLIHKEEYS